MTHWRRYCFLLNHHSPQPGNVYQFAKTELLPLVFTSNISNYLNEVQSLRGDLPCSSGYLKTGTLANSKDPDAMPHNAALFARIKPNLHG